MKRRLLAATALCLAVLLVPSVALASHSESAPDGGWAFEVPAIPEPTFEVQEPQEDPALQRRHVEAFDGESIYVETWLPEDPATGHPVMNVPTVITYSPYAKKGSPPNTHFGYMKDLVTRGYAFSTVHVRGTGESSGCLDGYGAKELDDGERALRYVATAEWSNGDVGMIGLSYPGATAINMAANAGDETRSYLKAIVVGAPGNVMVANYDGVLPYVAGGGTAYTLPFGYTPYSTPLDVVFWAEPPERVVTTRTDEGGFSPAEYWADRPSCSPEALAADADLSGDVTPYVYEREIRRGASTITAPTFMFHGFEDALRPKGQAGLFEQIDAPKFGLFGHFWHETPDDHYSGIEPEWERTDFKAMVLAWLDRHLKGIENGVDEWPTAQVQDNTGQWRAEADWPTTGGPVGQLVLGDEGMLGDDAPAGSSSYTEEVVAFDRDFELRKHEPLTEETRSSVTFRTPPLAGPLHVTGQPLLDLWVKINKSEGNDSPLPADAHLAAELIARNPDGSGVPYSFNFGARSLQHLEPLTNNLFLQAAGIEPPVDTPIRVPVRMEVVDFRIPAGGWLELRVSGSGRVEAGLEPAGAPTIFQHPSRTSGRAARVTILHDCQYVSALRFLMPRKHADLLNVREEDEGDGPLANNRGTKLEAGDGGGLATQTVCGRAPERVTDLIPTLGEEISYGWNPHSGAHRGGH